MSADRARWKSYLLHYETYWLRRGLSVRDPYTWRVRACTRPGYEPLRCPGRVQACTRLHAPPVNLCTCPDTGHLVTGADISLVWAPVVRSRPKLFIPRCATSLAEAVTHGPNILCHSTALSRDTVYSPEGCTSYLRRVTCAGPYIPVHTTNYQVSGHVRRYHRPAHAVADISCTYPDTPGHAKFHGTCTAIKPITTTQTGRRCCCCRDKASNPTGIQPNRHPRVIYKCTFSDWITTTCDLPQGRTPPPLPPLSIAGVPLTEVHVVKLLGMYVQADLGLNTQVNNMIKKGSQRLFMLRKLTQFNLSRSELLTCYKTFVRPTVEYAAPAWHAGLTTQQRGRIETIQKRACRTILGSDYTCYTEACLTLDLPTLDNRRRDLCYKHPIQQAPNPTDIQSNRHLIQQASNPTDIQSKGIQPNKHPIQQASNPTSIQSNRHPIQQVSNPTGIQSNRYPTQQASNPTGIQPDRHPIRQASNPTDIQSNRHPIQQASNPTGIQPNRHPIQQASNPTGIQSNRHPIQQASNPTGIQSNRHPIRQASNPTGIQSNRHPIQQASNSTGIQSNRYPIQQASNPTGIQSNRHPIQQAPNPTGIQSNRHPIQQASNPTDIKPNRHQTQQASNPTGTQSNRHPIQQASNSTGIQPNMHPIQQASNPTGIQSDRHPIQQASNPTGIQSNRHPIKQASNPTGIQSNRHPIQQASNPTGIQSNRHPIQQASNPTGIQPNRHPTQQASNPTGIQPNRHPIQQASNPTGIQPNMQSCPRGDNEEATRRFEPSKTRAEAMKAVSACGP
ncbi:hypothetical protein Bbelb_270120 [Branchiostoma belcheri]|nr:hypothetical protein Bbelb_270120 [Branchiostoma belcheri]